MKTKQEVISFLESKLGTKVVCVGNTSLSGQCVTLIKSLMEYLGVPDPYKARGHAKTAISAYLSEGIAKPGMGFLSVFSNKDMGQGYGHIWLSIDGTFYESNGVKALTVTKGKTYSYDLVCNFDSYVTDNTYRGYDLTNIDSMKVCVDDHIKISEGQLVDKTQYESIKGQLTKSEERVKELSVALGAKTASLLVAEQSAKTAKEALQKELTDQLDFGDKWEEEQDSHTITKNTLNSALWDYEEELKLPHPSEDASSRIALIKTALVSLTSSTNLLNKRILDLETENKKLNTHKKPIEKLSIGQCIIITIEKIKEKLWQKLKLLYQKLIRNT